MSIDKTTNTLSSMRADGTLGENRYRTQFSEPDADVATGLARPEYSTNAFPRRTPEFAQKQAHLWAQKDLWSTRFREHEAAYVEAFADVIAAGDGVEGYRRINMFDLGPEELEAEARKAGHSRAAYTLRAKESDFITEPIAFYGDHEKYPFADRRMLDNPFTKGQPIILPRGTTYTSRGRGGAKGRTVKTTVHSTYNGYTDGSVGKLFVRPGSITVVGAGSYFQDIIVTPELLLANNLPIFESPVNGVIGLRPDEH